MQPIPRTGADGAMSVGESDGADGRTWPICPAGVPQGAPGETGGSSAINHLMIPAPGFCTAVLATARFTV